jgi:hypothetical protein
LFHFAAANGHTNVDRTLHFHDAHADLVDKHGVMYKTIAQENEKEGMVEMLKEWLVNKNRI